MVTTSTLAASERRLATLATIDDLTSIDGADRIEAATVRGWTVVVGKGQYQVGDPVLYVEVDAALPIDDPRFAFLAERGTREHAGRTVHVVKTAKLRGVYSQGIVFPAADFPELAYAAPETYDTRLGITKWEPPLPAGMAALGLFPAFLRKTDAERVQNLTPETWAEIQADRKSWWPIEKIDGSSLTAWKTPDGVLHVAGRNWELDPTSLNAHWRAAEKAQLADLLEPGEWVQGEVAGPGVQGNPLALPGVGLFIFGYGTTDFTRPVRASFRDWPQWVTIQTPPAYGFALPTTIAEAVTQVEKLPSRVMPGRKGEGVVWTHRDGTGLAGLDGRHVWKSISPSYLLKVDR